MPLRAYLANSASHCSLRGGGRFLRGLLPLEQLLGLDAHLAHQFLRDRQAHELVRQVALLEDLEGVCEQRIRLRQVGLGVHIPREGVGDRDEAGVHLRAHQVLHELPGCLLVLAAFADSDAPGGIGQAALALVTVGRGDRGDADVQVWVALADQVDPRERADHHPDAAVDELLDLVLLLLGKDAGRNDACVVQRLDVFQRADDGLVFHIGLTVRQH